MKIIEYERQKNPIIENNYNTKKKYYKSKNNENNNNNYSEIKFNQFENKKEKFEDEIIDEIAPPCAIENEEIYFQNYNSPLKIIIDPELQNNDNNNNFYENNNFSYNQYYYPNNNTNYNLNLFKKKRKKKKKKNNF